MLLLAVKNRQSKNGRDTHFGCGVGMTAPTLSAMRGASFKDKLAVLEATTPDGSIPNEPGALKPRYDDLKKSLCVDALVAGCPDAFVDFYYLCTSGDGVGDDNLTADEMERALINPDDYEEFEEVPMDKMPFVKDALVAAESALRGDALGGPNDDPTVAVQDAYGALAEYFLGTDDRAKAAYFYDKCVAAAVAARRPELEMAACARVGKTHEAAGNLETAVASFERQLRLADHLSAAAPMDAALKNALGDARGNCVRTYFAIAERLAETDDKERSVAYLTSCLRVCVEAAEDAADTSHDAEGGGLDDLEKGTEGKANHRLGLAQLAAGRAEDAAGYQTRYLELSERDGDDVGVGCALRALGEAHLARGAVDEAAAALERFAAMESTGTAARARAHCSLGRISLKRRDYARSVGHFERFHELARGLGDARLLDVARVNLGVARGVASEGGFIAKVATAGLGSEAATANAESLVTWKDSRTPIEGVHS